MSLAFPFRLACPGGENDCSKRKATQTGQTRKKRQSRVGLSATWKALSGGWPEDCDFGRFTPPYWRFILQRFYGGIGGQRGLWSLLAPGMQQQPSRTRAHLHLLQDSTVPYSQNSTYLAWRLSNELDIAQPPHKSLPQLSQTSLEVRPLFTGLPQMSFIWYRMPGLWKALCVESRGCESGEDDGEVI
jgi:hypothetical protein